MFEAMALIGTLGLIYGGFIGLAAGSAKREKAFAEMKKRKDDQQ